MSLFTLDEVDQHTVRKYSRTATKTAMALSESQETLHPLTDTFDVFLSHSYKDATVDNGRLLGVKAALEAFDLDVYVDWLIDRDLNRTNVNAETARRLRTRMGNSRCLFFVTSENSRGSIWMPWELGYMDGRNGKVAILPLVRQSNRLDFAKQEYLGIYPYVDKHLMQGNHRWYLWINRSATVYTTYQQWLGGKPLTYHNVSV